MFPGSLAAAPASAEALARAYQGAYRVAYRLLGDGVDADGIARDALVAAGARRLRRRSLEAEACLRSATLALGDELYLGRSRATCVAGDGTGFGEVAHREDRRELRMAVRCLMGRERKVFVLEHLAGWSPPQVAAALELDAAATARAAEKSVDKVRKRSAAHRVADQPGVA